MKRRLLVAFLLGKELNRIATTKIRSIKGDPGRTLEYASNVLKTMGSYSTQSLQALEDVMNYVEQPEKVHDKQYVSGVNCLEDNARDEFVRTKKMWAKTDGIQCFHAIQSFLPGEADADTVHQIGIRLAELMWGDRFQVLVTTHLDKDHLHNHFVINSVSFLDGKKYHLSNSEKRRLRNLSDLLSREYNLSVVESRKTTRDRAKMEELGIIPPPLKPKKTSFRHLMRKEINELVKQTKSLEELYQKLESKGYTIKRDAEHVAIKAPNMERFARLRSLGDAYTPEALCERIRRQPKRTSYRIPQHSIRKIKREILRRPWFVRKLRYYYIQLQNSRTWRDDFIEQYGRPSVDHESVRLIEDYSAKIRILCRYQIKDESQARSFLEANLGTEDERSHLEEIINITKSPSQPSIIKTEKR